MCLSLENFVPWVERCLRDAGAGDPDAVAVAVSGGGDSMALLALLVNWAQGAGKYVHVISVDHGLRDSARDECALVSEYCMQFEHVQHQTVLWECPVDVRVQEEARKARYSLMCDYCVRNGIQHLFLGHHAGDQAETFLFRLAKGSGLDGLAAMRSVQRMHDVMLCRPLLTFSKRDLSAFCEEQNIGYASDPSNDDIQYARVRMRRSMQVLEAEGFNEKRLSVTAGRLLRAREALEDIADKVAQGALVEKNTNRIVYDFRLFDSHDEILLRIVIQCFELIGENRYYAPRLEKVEELAHDLKQDKAFRKRTLGGIIFERDDKQKLLILTREKPPQKHA